MSDASCRLMGVLFDMLEEVGASPEVVLEGTDLDLETLRDENNWIPWDDLCAVVWNTTAQVGGLDSLEERATRLMFGAATNRSIHMLTRALASPKALYGAMSRWIIPQLFSMLTLTHEDMGGTHIRLHVSYDGHYQESPATARLINATLVGLPTTIGLPRAVVELDYQGRSFTFDVYHPASRTLPSRFVRMFQAMFAPDSLTRELETQATNLAARYQELAAARAREERSSEAKSRFLALISHELRTPLNGILGTVQLMEDTEMTPAQVELVDSNRQSATHLLGLITSILDFTSLYAGGIVLERRVFSLQRVLQERQVAWAPQAAARGDALSVVIPEGAWAVVGDERRLTETLDHLLSNAVRFTRGGAVTCSAAPTEDGWRFQVSDTGIGMSPALLATAFEPLTWGDDSLTREHGGLGLGLSLVRNAVEAMGGRVGCESTEGAGTTVWFTLPLPPLTEASETEAWVVDEDTVASPGHAGPARILIVEDHPVNQLVIRRMIVSLGFDAEVASDGREGLERFTEGGYDAVLMDCQMPVMDGHTATRRIREYEATQAARRVPIIAVTANAMDSDKRMALDAGMDRYLTKPVDRGQLQRTLDELLAA